MAKEFSQLSRSVLLVVLLLVLLTVSSVEARGRGRGRGHLRRRECLPRCTYRCSETSHRKPCMFFCLKCCNTCRCVPPGTYGHKEVCPCYNNWKTKEGRPKCP